MIWLYFMHRRSNTYFNTRGRLFLAEPVKEDKLEVFPKQVNSKTALRASKLVCRMVLVICDVLSLLASYIILGSVCLFSYENQNNVQHII